MGSRGEPTEEDAWAQCDACQKWRLLPKDHVVDEGKKWTCALVGRSCGERANDAIEEPLKLDQFARKHFNKDNEKHTAVADAAIAAGRQDDITSSEDLIPFVQKMTQFSKTDRKGTRLGALRAYVRDQCAEEDLSSRTRFYDGIEDIVKAKDEKLLEFVKRRGVVAVVKSCCGLEVKYGAASGLRPRAAIAFSVKEHTLAGATRLARLETFKTLGLIKKFEKQLQKLK